MQIKVFSVILILAIGIPTTIQFPLTTNYPYPKYSNYHTQLCNDNQEYFTTTTIKNYSILYIINNTKSYMLNRPRFSIIESLIRVNSNITFHALLYLEYYILEPCLYNCKMLIKTNENNSKFVTNHFYELFNIDGHLHMICNNLGCRWGNLYCETYEHHDEL